MMKLKKEKFNLAKQFILNEGRPLEQKLFEFHFENGTASDVLSELLEYQNADGGFGNALEPDLRTPISSAVATSFALKIMNTISVSVDNHILNQTISYLLNSLNENNWFWVIAPNELKKHPHAPWWGRDDIVESFRGCIANPTAEITGLLLKYKDIVSENILYNLLEKLCDHLCNNVQKSPEKFQMHDLICYLTLISDKNLDEKYLDQMLPILLATSDSIVEKDETKWIDYCARPLWLCSNSNSDSAIYASFKDLVDKNLDYDIETQNADGSWNPFWSWFGSYPDVWPKACREWTGHLTLKNLINFKRFGRLE